MNNQKQETELKLSKSQLESVIKSQLLQENGLNDVFTMFVNGLMYSERQAFLSEAEQGNKGNGYRQATRAGIGSKLELKHPREESEDIRPIHLVLINIQKE